MLYTTNEDFNIPRSELDKNLTDISDFRKQKLNLKADKTELIVPCKKSKNSVIAKWNISIEDIQIPISSTVKYLGFFLDQNLTFSSKNVLRKMACGIKILNAIKNPFNINTRLIILIALVLSHLHHSSIILNSITQNLVASLDQQLNWAIKLRFNRRKLHSSRNLKVQYSFTDPILSGLETHVISGGSHKTHSLLSKPCQYLLSLYLKVKTRKLDCQVRHRTSIIENCVIRRGCKLRNSYHAKHPESTSK